MINHNFKDEIVYQVYPRSFYDSNSDGIGDLKGIISKLDYIASLGVTSIWLSPVFKSPMEDNGYDIADYYSIDPIFGSNEDMDKLIVEASKRNLGIIMDLVVNHTSDQHEWFKQARSSRDNPYHDYYIWRETPNELQSVFGGSAWEYNEATKEYYLHVFAKGQPDLNWENQNLRQEIYKMMNYWLNKGIYGFRMDVIENLGKEPDKLIISNGPHLHEILHEMNRATFGKRNSITIGECWGADNKTRLLYTDPAREELSMVFQFDDVTKFWGKDYGKWQPLPFDMPTLREVLFSRQKSDYQKAWSTIFWDNHDLTRALNRYCDLKYRERAAKMLFASTLYLRGTPFIYMGDEIGMMNASFKSIDEIKDIEAINAYNEFVQKGQNPRTAFSLVGPNCRDNARIPMQWEPNTKYGFTDGDPWIKGNKDGASHTVAREEKNRFSILNFYKKAIALRKSSPVASIVKNGTFKPLFLDDPLFSSKQIFAYERSYNKKTLTVIANFSNQDAVLPVIKGFEILSSREQNGPVLAPYDVIVYLDK
jgi:oligo-1,6-glucosidase